MRYWIQILKCRMQFIKLFWILTVSLKRDYNKSKKGMIICLKCFNKEIENDFQLIYI